MVRKLLATLRCTKLASTTCGLLLLLSPHFAFAETVEFRLFKSLKPDDNEALTAYIAKVFSWSQTAILLLATVVLIAAGIIYMGSAGNSKQIELSKKLMFGALSGVAVIVLGRFFLQYVVGVPWVN